jgi:short-subunit dehydrogenase
VIPYRGKTALITGASSGIGKTFAQALAERGAHLILVARSEGKLQELASALRKAHGVSIEVIAADLSTEGASQTIYQAVRQRGQEVDILINNAGFATHGRFETLAAERDHEEVMLNTATVADMTHAFLPAMLEKGEGVVVNVASTAAFQPVPYMAIYGATKAFVLSFSEALWAECRPRGVSVMALCPGATDTAFFDVAGSEAAVGSKMTPERVVAIALRALEHRRSYVVTGRTNALLAQVARLLPRQMVTRIAERTLRPGRERAS